MVDITPNQAFLAALANQFASARQGQGQGQPSSIPGLAARAGAESAPNVSGGAIGGGIPGTATTGQSVANSLLRGGGIGGDAVARQVATAFGNSPFALRGEPADPGDLGAGITGGSLGALLSVAGGPLSLLTLLPSLVASDALGLPLDPSLLTTTNLADLAFNGGREAGTLGVNPELGNVTINPNGAVVNNIRGGVFGGSGGGSGGEGGGDLGNRGGGNADQFDTPEFGA